MTYTFENLKEDVRKEAEALRVHATGLELARLDIKMLIATSSNWCYYGQMTGNCFSSRAAELIQMCCKRFFTGSALPDLFTDGNDMDMISESVVDGEVTGFVKKRTEPGAGTYYSAIEAYIPLPEARNANLISYLRGETETLEL